MTQITHKIKRINRKYINQLEPNKLYNVVDNWDNHGKKRKNPLTFTARYKSKYYTENYTIVVFVESKNQYERCINGYNEFYLYENPVLQEIQKYASKTQIPSLQTLAKQQINTSEIEYARYFETLFSERKRQILTPIS